MKIEEIKEKINEILPKNAGISKIEVEGQKLQFILLRQKHFSIMRNLFQMLHTLKKKINIRTDKTLWKILQQQKKNNEIGARRCANKGYFF